MPPWLLVDTQPDTLDTRVTRDTPGTCATRDARIPMGAGKENDAPGLVNHESALPLYTGQYRSTPEPKYGGYVYRDTSIQQTSCTQ